MKHQTSYLKRAREIQRIVSRHYGPRKTGPEPERGIPSPRRAAIRHHLQDLSAGPEDRHLAARSGRARPRNSPFRRAMRRVNRFRFEPGTVYLFTESGKIGPNAACTACSTAWTEGKSNSEAVRQRPCGLRYGEYLPDGYRYVRKAKEDEIRDFCYLHGYDRCRIERLHTPNLRNPAAGVP